MNTVPQAAFHCRLLAGWVAGDETISTTLAVMMGSTQKGLLRINQRTVESPSSERSGQYSANNLRQAWY